MRQHILPENEVNLMKVLDNVFDGLNELAKKIKSNFQKNLKRRNI